MGVEWDTQPLKSPQSDTCFALGSKRTKFTLTLGVAVGIGAFSATAGVSYHCAGGNCGIGFAGSTFVVRGSGGKTIGDFGASTTEATDCFAHPGPIMGGRGICANGVGSFGGTPAEVLVNLGGVVDSEGLGIPFAAIVGFGNSGRRPGLYPTGLATVKAEARGFAVFLTVFLGIFIFFLFLLLGRHRRFPISSDYCFKR